MGVSIAVSLSQRHGVPVLPELLLGVATVILVAIGHGWLRTRTPDFGQGSLGAWGMVAMGVLAYGSAWATLTESMILQAGSWFVATPLGVFVCLKQLRGFTGQPAFTWGLALVTPMVSATSGAQLWQAGAFGIWMWWAAVGCFLLSLVTGIPAFALIYRSRPSVAPSMAGTYWIPLGIVGQSTAAAQILFPTPVAVIYGTVMLSAGVPLAVYAMTRYYPSVAAFADYAPGWWGATFPVGTLSLGTALFAGTTGNDDFLLLSGALLLLLLAHLTLAGARAVTWWMAQRWRGVTPASAMTSGSR